MVLDGDKVVDHLTKQLVDASIKAHRVHKGSFDRVKLVKEMEVLTELIEKIEGGLFTFEYKRLEGALDSFDDYINGEI